MRFSDATLRGELYLRTDTFGTYEAQRSIVERVETLVESGPMGEASVAGRWESIHTPMEDYRDDALETLDTFERWADRNGFTLGPAFDRRTRTFLGQDCEQEVVVFPVASLALYEDDALQAVFPCSDAGMTRHYGVPDALDAFESCHWEWFDQFRTVTVDRDGPLLDTAAPPS
ncbi:MAG: HTH domain-containing protein [Salinirussus sp.]